MKSRTKTKCPVCGKWIEWEYVSPYYPPSDWVCGECRPKFVEKIAREQTWYLAKGWDDTFIPKLGFFAKLTVFSPDIVPGEKYPEEIKAEFKLENNSEVKHSFILKLKKIKDTQYKFLE